jgi:hypothetical protein
LRLAQGLHLGELAPERRNFMPHLLDLKLCPLDPECLDFFAQYLDPSILARVSF